MRKTDFNLVIQALKKFDTFLIASHENPDGDAIGAMLACGLALEKMRKRVTLFSPDPLPENLRFLPGSAKIISRLQEKKFDAIIVLDASDIKRLRLNLSGLRYQALINIDHHPQKKPFGDLRLVAPNASSASEIVYLLVKNLVDLNAAMATCLLTGIFTDTGSFQHANTSPYTMEIAAHLMKTGANLNKIARATYQNKSLSALKVWGLALARVKQDRKKGVTLSAITQKDLKEIGAKQEDLEGVVNVINSAAGTKYALLLLEQKGNKIRASLRSEKGRGVDVGRIAERYGGGGHALASGFTIKGRLAWKKGKWMIKK
ncbi:MAG: bifunctional oligoribonuclease/PAP phosphatase NrnA [bacterium]|nr:bifunctional oligoribonuclease/PAP phosphatase NrnA [bacterium]